MANYAAKHLRLIEEGQVLDEAMRGSSISENDFEEALRLGGHPPDPTRVRLAYLERNGRISIIPHEQSPRVLEVTVAAGVQTIRIQLE